MKIIIDMEPINGGVGFNINIEGSHIRKYTEKELLLLKESMKDYILTELIKRIKEHEN